ncbi:MAG: hypothetical protein A3D15_04325 [Alphaproteobacteria bacterium RIFCSPHIGHO2_02_FULL_40_34]|nr:MAG: hypothetical protein A3D15_04325 [Alphaproteobacteria bacterium RIFCSPHIGHO2_02_FULL_40_34]OFX11374.1 MAG: hypothetical protein A3G22_06215 [Alphaproteobacteria bacterium RIFCSPLOWO2_12_FULL_40_11]
MKNFLILTISILALTMNTTNNNAEAKMFNKFKKGFYFEKYKTAEEAKAALLELHPIGSDVEGLVETLEGAGAETYEPVITEKYKNNPRLENMCWYQYSHRTMDSLFPKTWGLTIEVNNKKLSMLTINFYQGE